MKTVSNFVKKNILKLQKHHTKGSEKPRQHSVKSPIHNRPLLFVAFLKSVFWFSAGVLLGLFFLVSFLFIFFQQKYANRIYPGVMVYGIDFGGKTEKDVKIYFAQKNAHIENTQFAFVINESVTTVSAKQIDFGFDQDLLATQAFSIGRSNDIFSNISLVFQSYLNTLNLSPSYHYSDSELERFLIPVIQQNHVEPINALFAFENGKVTTFLPSSNGQDVDISAVKHIISSKLKSVTQSSTPQSVTIHVPLKTIEAKITTDKANNLGIKELIGSGTSLFEGSIESRIYNITVATSKIHGALVPPGEVFSFNKTLGDVSMLTGYKQAYVIQNGKTVLGDGGGVCQVSTTLFRTLLNAGLPILERHAHAYRVHYYEEDTPPGFDATIYVPTVDLKFKNDTKGYILIQASLDQTAQKLTFTLYGTSDQRKVTISKPVITSQTPAPPPLYQDDPTLPKGVEKQVDFAAPGADVYFTRQVEKNGKIIISDKFVSNFKPWQAVYLRGTKD